LPLFAGVIEVNEVTCPKKKCRRKFFQNFKLFVALPLVGHTWIPQEISLNGTTKVKFDEESLSCNDATKMM